MIDRIADTASGLIRSFFDEAQLLFKRVRQEALLLLLLAACGFISAVAIAALLTAAVIALAEELGLAPALALVSGVLLLFAGAGGALAWFRFQRMHPIAEHRSDPGDEAATAAHASSDVPTPSDPMNASDHHADKPGSPTPKIESLLDPGVLAASAVAVIMIVGPGRVLRAAAAATDTIRVAGALIGSLDLIGLVSAVSSAVAKASASSAPADSISNRNA